MEIIFILVCLGVAVAFAIGSRPERNNQQSSHNTTKRKITSYHNEKPQTYQKKSRKYQSNTPSSNNYVEKNAFKLLKMIDYEPKNIFNHIESSVFGALKEIISKLNSESKYNIYSVFGQVSLSELFKVKEGQDTPNSDYYWAFAKRRIDFLIVKEEFESKYCRKYKSIVAIEINGSGHYGEDKEKRMRQDKEKRLLLEKIGIPLLVINTIEEEKSYDANKRNSKIYKKTITEVENFLSKMRIIG